MDENDEADRIESELADLQAKAVPPAIAYDELVRYASTAKDPFELSHSPTEHSPWHGTKAQSKKGCAVM